MWTHECIVTFQSKLIDMKDRNDFEKLLDDTLQGNFHSDLASVRKEKNMNPLFWHHNVVAKDAIEEGQQESSY